MSDSSGTALTGTYAYEYSVVDSTGGETAPGPTSSNLTVTAKSIDVSGLPTGVRIRLYRECSCTSNLFYKVADFTPGSSTPQFVDNIADATSDVVANLLPQSQNRPAVAATGYYEFVPGVPMASTLATSTPVASPAFSGKGWVVDAPGGVSIPSGTWTFTTKLIGKAGNGTARLDIGMWKVDSTGAVVGSAIIAPATTGENATANIATTTGTTSPIVTTIASVPAITLQSNEHLYVQFWRHQTAGSTGTPITTLLAYDGTAQITHPTANGFPNLPALGTTPARVNAPPQLSATFSDPDAADTGTLSFQLCSDSACNTVLQSGTSSSGIANGASGTWTPATLSEGTYYWRAQATDSFVPTGNVSGWSATSSFIVDTTPPGVPTIGAPAAAARVNSAQLSATFVDSDSTDSGAVNFRVCTSTMCSTVVTTGSSATVAGGTAVSWTPAGLADGTYYWEIGGQDVAGNQSAWTAAQSFVLDTNPPGVPGLSGPADGSYLGAAPTLSGVFSSSDAGDSGTVSFQVCSDAACTGVQASGSSASGLLNGATGSWTPTGLVDGLHYWRAQAQDGAGNLSAWSAARSFTLDTTAPAVPPLGSVAARGQVTPQLSGTFSDPPATDSGSLAFQLCSTSACTSRLQTHTATGVAGGATANWTPASLADGTYFWRVQATDAAGNLSAWSAAASFGVDTVPPGLPGFVSPASAGRVNSSQLSATFVDSDSTDSGTVTFQLCSDAACATALSSSTSATVVGGTGVTWTPTDLADGTYYWRLSALDVAGNQGSWTPARRFVLDTNPPGVPALSGPADASYLGAAPSLLGGFSSSDAGDSGSVTFQVCSDAACTGVQASGASASGLLDGATGSWTPAGLAAGLHYWRAQAQDAAGNLSAWSAARSFTLETAPPSAPTPSSPAAGQLTTRAPALTASYTSSTGGGDSGAVIFQLCSSSSCASALQTETVAGLQQGDSATWAPAGLADGTYHWRVRAQDLAGNLSGWTATQSFTIDSTPPPAPVLAALGGAHVNASPALAGLVKEPSNPGDSAELLVELCSDQACGTVVGTSYSGFGPVGAALGWQPPHLADGAYFWRALAQDAAGNQSAWSAVDSFVVDTSAPGVPAPSGPAVGAVVNKVLLRGALSGSAVGSIDFEVCKDPLCTTIVALGIAPATIADTAVTWTPTGLPSGSYFWRVSAHDQAGNASAWSPTMSFTLDQTPPPAPQALKAVMNAASLTLRWQAPAGDTHVAGYVLYVDGKRSRVLPPTTLSLTIALRKHDTRLFSVAAFDVPGVLGRPTRRIGPGRL